MFFLKVSFTCFIYIQLLAAQESLFPWELIKQQEGITVYTRTVQGSSYKEFRGETDIHATVDQLLSFINNAQQCPYWRYKCIKMLTLSEGYLYQLSHLPWPFSHRYTVMKSTLTFNKKNNRYTLKLVNIERSKLPNNIQAQLPELEDTLQMRFSDGYWQFTLNPSHHRIHILYQMHGDPGINLPSQLTQLGIINSAFITLSHLKKHFTH